MVNHEELGCQLHEPTNTKLLPAEKAFVEFKNFKSMVKMPFVIYADFECITKKIDMPELSEEDKKLKEKKSYTDKYQEHIPCGYSYKVVSTDPDYKRPLKVYRGEDCMEQFMKDMLNEQSDILDRIKYINQ